MAKIITAEISQDIYYPELDAITTEGEVVEVRGRTTVELLNVITQVNDPSAHCILIPSRKWNPFLAMSEALWILAGRNDVAALKPYNSHIVDYSDDGVTLYGAYGARIYDQIDDLIERLRKDPSDRRAVLQIWDSHERILANKSIGTYDSGDLTTNSKDPPCNNLAYFKLRNNKLHMTVMCRSNDIHFGLFAVNLPTFGILQEYIAARLGVELGTQTHLSNSLHYYTDDKRAVDITERMLKDRTVIAYPKHQRVFTDLRHIESHEQFAEICSNVLDGKIYTKGTYPDFLSFVHYYLKCYSRKESFPDITVFQDWKLASEIFKQEVWRQ